ncbi:ABC transporter substrate-binding protein [Treponema zioleckii]|uniref:ABC transporter substrate-binding protein n=1 Tax=Treponema zioleckii TaxID=331680 RepID=UPI00168A7804|nr:ABC transporter substrate-binding protein [Treponema zioleckii]
MKKKVCVRTASKVAVAFGMSALLALSVGCNEKKTAAKVDDGTIRIEGAFRGEEEARFQEIVKIFNEQNPQFHVTYEGSPDFEVQIQVETQANTPPDIAAIPQPGTMKRFADAGWIKPLDSEVVAAIEENYAPVWKELGSYNGATYGVFHRVNAKSFVWYNKKEWAKRGYSIPKTWDELRELEARMVNEGVTPWSVGFESAAASGWPGTDWLEDMVLRTAGPDVYDKWVNHEIQFDDPAIVNALKYCGEIFLNNDYVYGGSANIVSLNYGDSVKPLFENPPKAMMNRQGNFITGFMQDEIQSNLEENVGVFALPGVDPQWGTPVLGGGDQFVAFTDKPGVKEFMKFLTTWEACAPWARIGGALFPHKNQNFNDYGNALEREIAEILVSASVFRFDASDLMPTEVGSGSFWTGMVNYVSGAESAEECLKVIDETWPQ